MIACQAFREQCAGLYSQLQVECKCRGAHRCCKCWKPTPEFPGHFVVNLGASTLTRPKARLALDTMTCSSIPTQLVTPTTVAGADNLEPGMLDNRIAEVAMVCYSPGNASLRIMSPTPWGDKRHLHVCRLSPLATSRASCLWPLCARRSATAF